VTPQKPPFPWFGGKSRAATLVWDRLGDVRNYIEPFFGSGAILFARPTEARTETINDKDRFVANFWRAVQAAPEAVAVAADWPVSETDLEARHAWLVSEGAARLAALMADPDGFDARIAGWWVWGQCAWIGSGWCSGEGPWTVQGGQWTKRNAGKGVNRKLPHLGNAGKGVNRKLPHLGDAGKGVNRQLPHLGDAGKGVNRQLPHLRNAGQGVNRQLPHLRNAGQGADARHRAHLIGYMQALAARLRYTRVACGDWRRVLTPSVTYRHGLTGVVLDPPYGVGEMDYSAGGNRSRLTDAVRDWAIEHGDDPKIRIALCGYDGQHEMPDGWTVSGWRAAGGYSSTAAADTQGKANRHRERIWFSPHCLAVPELCRRELVTV
jgi:hypothetical protein